MSSSSNHPSPNSILNAETLIKRLNSGEKLTLLDVRESIEFHTHNIGGTNIPLSRLRENAEQLGLNKDQEIIVVCKAGLRSEAAQSILQEMGYTQVKNLEGGLLAVMRVTK